ncbi:conserved hypothetical protein [Tenacibaculum amylolyticum]
MKFQKRFGNRKRTNPQRGLMLIVLLVVILYLFFNTENILARFF